MLANGESPATPPYLPAAELLVSYCFPEPGRTQARLRTRILVAHRLAAADRPQVCRPDPDGLTLGIADAADRITTLAAQVKRIRRRRDWAISTHPAGYQPPEPAADPPLDAPA